MKNVGNGTIKFTHKPTIVSYACAMGKKEGEGPMGKYFDVIEEDEYHGEKSWEQAECGFMKQAVSLAIKKAKLEKDDIDFAVAGDLMNQCTSSSFFAREAEIPFLGVYGACSTMAESLAVGAAITGGGGAEYVLCATASHFCSAEKQFRTPLEYGGQRTPTAQWTVTGSGAVILGKTAAPPYIDSVTVGRVIDLGVCDANNMGGAMAPAFADTIIRHLEATGRTPDYYDLILSGDLGLTGMEIAKRLFERDAVDIGNRYNDCGAMMFEKDQDTHAGGSGCGCSAGILCGYVLPEMKKGNLRRVLFAATGALLSPTLTMQGESIPSISHAISIEA